MSTSWVLGSIHSHTALIVNETEYYDFASIAAPRTETQSQGAAPFTGTWSLLCVFCSTNSFSTANIVTKSRIAGVDGNQSVSVAAGVTGDSCTKNSPPDVKICKALLENTPSIAFTWSVSKVTSMPSSANLRPASKLKKSLTTLPHRVFKRFLEPPKYNLPSWKVQVLGHPLVALHTSSALEVPAAVSAAELLEIKEDSAESEPADEPAEREPDLLRP